METRVADFALTTSELLGVWDRGERVPPAERALLLLAAALPEQASAELAALPVGERDRRLLALRAWLFGSTVEAVQRCPGCHERLELMLDIGALLAMPASHGDAPHELTVDDLAIAFRLPTAGDLVGITAGPVADPGAALLARCIVVARRGDTPVDPDRLPAEVVAAVADAMERADPLARVELALCCASCGQRWTSCFDITSFLWEEIAGWGTRALREVHQLARAYGWPEREILALSPARRRRYLEMIDGG